MATVVVIAVLATRYLVWLDLSNRCVITIRPSVVGYDNRVVKLAPEGFNEYAFLLCSGVYGDFRFLTSYLSGYYNVLPNNQVSESGNTPSLDIGKCSPF